MKVIYFFQYLVELLVFFIALFSEVCAYSSSSIDLKGLDSKQFKVSTEKFDVSANKFYGGVNQDFDDCINWYYVILSSNTFGPLIVPSIPKGLFIFFSKKRKSGCNIDNMFKERFLSIPKINIGFDTSVINKFTKLYSEEEMSFELNKINMTMYLDVLSKSNLFTPEHPEFFSLEGDELSYIHFPQLDVDQKIEKELLNSLFELDSSSIPIISLRRLSIKNNFKNAWETKIMLTKMVESDLNEKCKYGNLEVVRRLNGSGFHWSIETEIINFEGGNTPMMLDLFNREIFFDIDEISQQNERKNDGILVPLHPVHIERPSEESDSSLLLSIGKLSSIPIHARYQSACNGCNYKAAILRFPSVFIFEEGTDNHYCLVPNMRLEVTQNKNVKVSSSQKEIIIDIPVGNSQDIGYVFIATIFTIIITTVTTGISIKKY